MTVNSSADRFGLPPPPLELELKDGDRAIGWISDDRIGVRGFGDAEEAVHAAWVAHRTLARRLARSHGTRPIPIDIEPLALQRRGEAEVILAGGRPIATLVRPGAESRAGSDAFAFEIRLPPPVDELRLRAMAQLIYRTLRKSGLRWALLRPAPNAANDRVPARTTASRGRERASTVTHGGNDVIERIRQRTWRLPAPPWRRATQPA